MEISLPAWLGALAGMMLAAAIYAPGIRLVERHLRNSSDVKTSMERGAFESKLSIVRRLILAFNVAALAAAGYWIGNMFASKLFSAPGG